MRWFADTILAAVMLASTGGPVLAAEAPDDIVVRFCYWANFEENALYQGVARAFEAEHPGVHIASEWFVGDYGYKLQLALISGTVADIILMDDELFPAYAIRGYLEDLGPYMERDAEELRLEEFLPTSIESFNYRGFQGALPWDGNTVLVFYNKDLFDAEGIPYPDRDWTWSDFRDYAKRLTKDLDGDGRTDQYGTNFQFEFMGFEPLLWCFGGDVLNADRTRSALHEPQGVAAARFAYEMMHEDHSVAQQGEVGFLTEVQLLTGRVAMVQAGSYMIPMLNRAKGAMRWDVAHMPVGPHGDRYTRVTWDGISISAHTDARRKAIAWDFIKYFVRSQNQAAIGQRQRGIPVRRPEALAYYVNPETPAEEEIALEATAYGKLTPITPRFLQLRDVTRIEYDRLNLAQVTGTTPEESFARLEAQINDVLARDAEDWSDKVAPAPSGESMASSWLKAIGLGSGIVAVFVALLMVIRPVRRSVLREWHEGRNMLRGRRTRRSAFEGILFASPWLLGLLLFTAFPILFSIVLSFCEWDPYEPISEMRFIGLGNFQRAFSTDKVTGDPLVPKALYNTFYYAVFSVPLSLALSLGLAVLLNQKIRGITIFRTVFYVPSIVAGVATVILWTYIFNPVNGPLNSLLRLLNRLLDQTVIFAFIELPEPLWLGDPAWAKPAMIMMAMWGTGGAGMLIFLAGLQGVPDQLYEAARIDGACRFRQFWNVTLPMLTPTIYFNLIMGIIGSLKVFMQAYVMTDGHGGVDQSLLFFVLHLYNKAFVDFEMGYASALAWILFSVILLLTLLIIRSSAVWVYYESERPGR